MHYGDGFGGDRVRVLCGEATDGVFAMRLAQMGHRYLPNEMQKLRCEGRRPHIPFVSVRRTWW
jgi:hypothetical protein